MTSFSTRTAKKARSLLNRSTTVKFFNKNRLTKTQLRKDICTFAKNVGVNRVIFNDTGKKVLGTYNATTRNVYINLKQTKQQMLMTFVHEISHHEAAKKNKWKQFHFGNNSLMKADAIFDIENKIDGFAKKIWQNHVDIKQWGAYKYFYPKANKKTFVTNN